MEQHYTESQMLAAIAAYRILEDTARGLYVGDRAKQKDCARGILEKIVPGVIDDLVPKDIRRKVNIESILSRCRECLSLSD